MASIIRPQEGPQREFNRSTADIAIYGGAAGGGKSWSLVFEAARNVNVLGYCGIIFRRTSPQLKGGGSIWEETQGIYPYFGGVPKENPVLEWNFPAGAKIEFSHLQHVKDVYAHMGKQYAFVGFDELTHFEEKQFWYLISRMRSTSGVVPYLRATTNPDPDSWVRKFISWWIDDQGSPVPERQGVLRWFIREGDDITWADNPEDLEDFGNGADPMSVTFIAASLEDNPALTSKDPGYRSRLLSLPRVEREQLLGGNWNIRPAAGLYFQRSYFEIVDESPVQAKISDRCRAWDRAATKPSSSYPDPDWTIGVRYSRAKDGMFYVEHVERFRGTPLENETRIINTAASDPQGTKVAMWQDPGGAGKSEVDRMRSLLAGYRTEVVKAAKDKVTYAGPASSQAEAGHIRLVKGPWNDSFLTTLEAFPDGKHDDDVDALSLAHMVVSNNTAARFRALAAWD